MPSVTASVEVLTQTVLRLCDAKGDFSYIYTTNPRSVDRRWRPVPHPTSVWLHPILERPLTGSKQRGMLDGHGLKLHGMVALPLSQPEDLTSREAAMLHRLQWLARLEDLPLPTQVTNDQIMTLLEVAGLREPVTLVFGQYGCIAMLHEQEHSDEHYVAWAVGELRWTFGGHPGIARVLDAEGRVRKYAPLVFFGEDLRTKQPERFIKLEN